MRIRNVQELDAWKQSHQLTLWVYHLTSNLPASERFGLLAQMRRAAVSVPANIAEGFKRRHYRDKVRFYNIAESSLEELRYYLLLCKDLGYFTTDGEADKLADTVARLLYGLVAAVERAGGKEPEG